MRDTRLTLPDGRRLAAAEYGAASGDPVIYCHGLPGSRLEAAFADPVAERVGTWLIAADRPGFGMSDYQPGRTILGWADDVAALADHLGVERFSVLGVSGGAPYALACAFALADRVQSAAIVSGVGPPAAVAAASATTTSGLGLRLTASLPWTADPLMRVVQLFVRHATPLLFAMLVARSPVSDRRLLHDEKFRGILATSLREAFRNGARGPATDLRLLAKPWDFAPGKLRVPVHLWHGGQDRVVPMTMGQHLQRDIPDCRSTYLDEHGHYSLIRDQARCILLQVSRPP